MNSTTFTAERDGSRFEISIQIGEPYLSEAVPGAWGCSVAMSGLYEKLPDQHGVNAFQALSLAVRLTLTLLSGFKEDGGRIFFEGEEVPLDAYGA